MNLEPQKFFIGLLDFFSVILPGALLTWFVGADMVCWLQGGVSNDSRFADYGLAAFLLSSYLLGHFIFLFGAALDPLYERIRTGTSEGRFDRLARGKALPWCLTRGLAWLWLKQDADRAVRLAERIRERYLERVGDDRVVNAFQWCKARLALNAPAALAIVNRFEADSKFFRSLVVLLIVLVVWSWLPWDSNIQPGAMTVVGIALLPLAFWRYFDQRVKATDQAYWFVITQEAAIDNGFRPSALSPDGLTHAGGVVFRRAASGSVEYLLVSASHDPDNWVLPKGHIEQGERPVFAAIREVREESGVWASWRGELGDHTFGAGKESVRVRFYLMEQIATATADHEARARRWLTLADATKVARYDETKDLLKQAEERLARKGGGKWRC